MRVLILGAGGGVGSRIVGEARSRGHDVTGAGREVVRDADTVAAAAAGHDLVISAAFDRSRPDSLLEILDALLHGLPRAGVERLILVGGAGTLEVEPGKRVVDLDDFNPDYKAEALAHADALDAPPRGRHAARLDGRHAAAQLRRLGPDGLLPRSRRRSCWWTPTGGAASRSRTSPPRSSTRPRARATGAHASPSRTEAHSTPASTCTCRSSCRWRARAETSLPPSFSRSQS